MRTRRRYGADTIFSRGTNALQPAAQLATRTAWLDSAAGLEARIQAWGEPPWGWVVWIDDTAPTSPPPSYQLVAPVPPVEEHRLRNVVLSVSAVFVILVGIASDWWERREGRRKRRRNNDFGGRHRPRYCLRNQGCSRAIE